MNRAKFSDTSTHGQVCSFSEVNIIIILNFIVSCWKCIYGNWLVFLAPVALSPALIDHDQPLASFTSHKVLGTLSGTRYFMRGERSK